MKAFHLLAFRGLDTEHSQAINEILISCMNKILRDSLYIASQFFIVVQIIGVCIRLFLSIPL